MSDPPYDELYEMPKKAFERHISHVMAYAFFNAPKSKNFNFGSFPVLNLITCVFNAPLFYARFFFEIPDVSYLILKNGVFKKTNIKEWGIKITRDLF